MDRIGILAYGSLIEDPGCELSPLIRRRIQNVETPFNIEFSRKSSSRNYAPTVVPVDSGGAAVNATIFVLVEDLDIKKAVDLVWRRETGNEASDNHYNPPERPSVNHVVVGEISDFYGVEKVLYAKIGANISNPTSKQLAELAVSSAREKAGKLRKDGISYLISLKRQEIMTPLMPEYEEEILLATGTQSLEEAYEVASRGSL